MLETLLNRNMQIKRQYEIIERECQGILDDIQKCQDFFSSRIKENEGKPCAS